MYSFYFNNPISLPAPTFFYCPEPISAYPTYPNFNKIIPTFGNFNYSVIPVGQEMGKITESEPTKENQSEIIKSHSEEESINKKSKVGEMNKIARPKKNV